jgi:tetratricopeptide (TPR) repeat protein
VALVAGVVGTAGGLVEAKNQERLARGAAEEERQAKVREAQRAEGERLANEKTQKRLAQIEKGVELFAGMLQGINPREEEEGGEPLYVQLRQRAEKAADALDAEAVGDPPAVARLQTILGDTLRELGSYAKAVEVLEKARAIREREPGADQPDTLTTLNNLAMAYEDAGKLPKAIALFEQVRDVQVKKLGADHADTVTTLHNLAMAYLFAGRLPESIALHEQAATGIAKLKFRHRFASRIIGDAITAYETAGQLDKVEGWRRQWLMVVKENFGGDSPAYAGELAALGLNLLKQKKSAGAETILRECLAIREKQEPNAWTTFNTQSMLGAALLSQKKYKDAEPLLLKGYEGMKAREKAIPPQAGARIPEALDRLIELYTATDKPEEAKKWRAERAKYPNLAPRPQKK